MSPYFKAAMAVNLGVASFALVAFTLTSELVCAAVAASSLFGTHVSYRLYEMSNRDRKD